ncbi:MAG TPA: hypothetical protein VJ323_22100, partial [Bryobacteraceae bacterium]|nr:hypothetical protein [Bryobacteraceae bacterium]
CVIILAAALDRVSDPPATKPAGVEVNALTLGHAADAGFPQSCSWICYGPPVQFERCWLGTGEASDAGHPDSCASVVRHAADPSPPSLRLLPA